MDLGVEVSVNSEEELLLQNVLLGIPITSLPQLVTICLPFFFFFFKATSKGQTWKNQVTKSHS